MAFLLSPEKIVPFKIAVWASAVFVAAVILLRHLLPGIWHTIRGFQYLLRGPEVIDDLYEKVVELDSFQDASATDRFKAKGQPFKAETPSNSHILVSKPEHIEELSQASHKHLSLHAVAKEVMISFTLVT
ncbi:MAG: hypothetical protein Q9214_002779 [Letrouitia sp. 1 TL-2023]